MAYRVIYPKRLQLYPLSEGEDCIRGKLIHDWDQYGIFNKSNILDLTLVMSRGVWRVDQILRHDVDVFYLNHFKVALNFYFRRKIGAYIASGVSLNKFNEFHFENVFF